MNIYNTYNWKKNLCCPMAFAIAFFGMCGISQAAIPVAVNDSAGASIQGSNFTFDGGEVATDSVQGKSSQLKALLANAQSCLDSKMNADVKQALTKSIADAENILKSSEANSTAISNAYSDLGSKIWAAQLSIAVYKEISVFFTKAEKLDEAGHNAFNKYAADIQDAWNNGTITDGEEEINILADKLRIATKAQTTNNSDWTYAIYNPSFEDKGKHWVAMTGYKPLDVLRKDSLAWAYADGERYAYRYNDGDTPVDVSFYQDVDTVQLGLYKVKATIYTNSKTVSIYGNELKTVITPCSSTDEAREVEQILVSWNGKRITLGVIGTLQKGEEFRIDNFRLEYLSHDVDIEAEKVPDDVPINKDIRNQQNNAVEQFRDNPQPTTLSAVLEAIAEAKESEKIYKQFADYFGKVKELDEAAQSMFNRLAGEVIDAYDNGDITDGVAELEIIERSFKAVCEYSEATKVIVKVDISDVQPSAGENTTAPVVTLDDNDNSVYVFEPADEKKDQTITLVIPLDVIVAGTTYKIIIDLYPVLGAYARPNYLSFGLKGNGSKIYERSSADLYALGKYVYANDKEMKLEYEFTATQDMQSPVFVIKTETPVDAEDESTRSVGLKGISLVSETSSTAIETTRTETEVIPISIYNISGVNISSFQKGINVVRFSDGSVKKVFR